MSCSWLTVALAAVVAVSNVSSAPAAMTDVDAYNYLMQYGYAGAKTTVPRMSREMADFQKHMGLPATGALDKATREMMSRPRCGFPDKTEDYAFAGDKPRQFVVNTEGRRWKRYNLTYRNNNVARTLGKSQIDAALTEAFRLWSSVTPLTFTPLATGPVDIDMSFVAGDHGDGAPFDGQGRVLAHAFLPVKSKTHFDDDETWTYKSARYDGRDLLNVATHEFGHALGLEHSDVQGAVMYPMYSHKTDFKLHEDDIEGITNLYGRPSPSSDVAMLAQDPVLCQDASIDAALTTPDGSAYVFKGDKHWKLANNMIVHGYPKPTASFWERPPSRIDAAFSSRNKTYFFRRSEVWKYSGTKLDEHFPMQISRAFPGITTEVDLAFVWSGNGKMYFFKGDKYYRYIARDDSAKKTYPQPVGEWKYLPADMDAAMSYTHEGSTRTYFFKGQQFYRYNDRTNQVDDNYPRSTGKMFFGCA